MTVLLPLMGVLLLALGGWAAWGWVIRRRLRRELRDLKDTVDRMPGVVFRYRMRPDKSNHFTYVSAGLGRIYGIAPSDVAVNDEAVVNRIHPDDLPRMGESKLRSVRELTPWVQDYRVRLEDGQMRWLRGNAEPQRLDDGSVVWNGFIMDWTEQALAEAALRESERQLQEAQQVARVGHFVHDVAAGRWTSSPMLDTIWGLEPGFDKTAENWLAQVPPSYHAGILETYQRATPERPGFDLQYPITRRSDGQQRWVSAIGRIDFDDRGRPVRILGTMQDITERKRAEAEIQSLAYYDPLTGLPNRRLLMDRIEQALVHSTRTQLGGALLFIDLDNFKDLNDTLGHEQGDRLLVQVAQRLLDCVRESDTACRLGGDEFVLLLQDLSADPDAAATEAEQVARKVLERLNRPYTLVGGPRHSTPSIGIATFQGQRLKVDDLLKRADVAMYQAKAAGRNTLRFFDHQMQESVEQRARLVTELREALAGAQFALHYQPQVNERQEPIGMEALLRWRHPERGLVGPAEFVAQAEQAGLIHELGDWVLRAACAQLAAWEADDGLRHRLGRFTLAVNISAPQLRDDGFVTQVRRVLRESGAAPERLKLELTESLMVHDVEDAIAKMGTLRELGVHFSLDDFGTGYSSLAYLKRLPLDQLKIDRSFVRDLLDDSNDLSIARTIVALGNALGLEVIAEGVETEPQRALLDEIGCRHYQGYLFSRPLPAADALTYLREHLPRG